MSEIRDNAPAGCYVVLGRPDGSNALHGLVEHSFSMGTSPDFVRIWWTGKGYSILGEDMIDGRADAEGNSTAFPDFEVYDASADDLPIDIDWDAWRAAKRKFDRRNAPFRMRDQ